MKLSEIVARKPESEVIHIAQAAASDAGLGWTDSIEILLKALVAHPRQAPNVQDTKHERGIEVVLRKWVAKYWKGHENRASLRESNVMGTVADPILGHIISARLPKLTSKDLELINHAHRLDMAAENINGVLLEEFLAQELLEFGWHCAWGESVKAVDFVNSNGRLLQVKNRDNSENSSSSQVREGTTIEKWYRIRSGRVEYKWEALNRINDTDKFCEESYVTFARECLAKNPACLAMGAENPWGVDIYNL